MRNAFTTGLCSITAGLLLCGGCNHPAVHMQTEPGLNLNDWSAVHADFASRSGLIFKQTWQNEPSPNFAGGSVKLLWEPDALVVFARMADADIISTNTTFNTPFFTGGDVFELFLRPEGQDAYLEIHVGPQNQKMQLKIDESKAFYARRNTWPPVEELIAPYKVEDPILESNTQILPSGDAWETVIRIPFSFLSDGVEVKHGTPLHGSFCRYDYTTGEKEPVYSSTSQLEKLDFHRQEFWDIFIPAQ
jgi:hypothetical protein